MAEINRGTSPGMGTQTGRSVQEAGKEAAATVQGVAGQIKDKAEEWASAAGSKIADAKETVGEGIENLGGKLRGVAPERGRLHDVAESVAGGLETAGQYLQEHDFGEMGENVTDLIRRYPVQAVLVGLGIGFLLARATRS
jgi:hypothetical protein